MKTKLFGFIESESLEVSKIVENYLHNYLLLKRLLLFQFNHDILTTMDLIGLLGRTTHHLAPHSLVVQ
jgi:hypothetical protein